MTRKQAHIVSLTRWDREWYLPFEHHHRRLIELMGTLPDTQSANCGICHSNRIIGRYRPGGLYLPFHVSV